MTKWPRDNPEELRKFYGDPGSGAVEAQLVTVVPPFKMYYDGKQIKGIRFHKKAAGALKAALDEIWDTCGKDQAKLDKLGVSKYGGSYNARKIAGSNKWSNHAYGAAIDLDPDRNGFNTGHGTMPAFVVAAFKRQGARWGGDYKGRTDPMHFEFCYNGEPEQKYGLIDAPEVDSDGGGEPEAPETETTEKLPWWKRLWAKVAGGVGLGSVGLGGASFTLDYRFVLALCALVVVGGLMYWLLRKK